MVSTTAVCLMVSVLAGCHLRVRRHANWAANADARFYITSGYALVAIAVYFLSSSTSTTSDWTWIVGNFWSLVAVTSFVYGFDVLNADYAKDTSQRREATKSPGRLSTHRNPEVPPGQYPPQSTGHSSSTNSPRMTDRVGQTLPTTGQNGR
jgi:hypothetical protein